MTTGYLSQSHELPDTKQKARTTCRCSFLSNKHQRHVFAHPQVADDYIGLDLLSSQMDVKTSNFRGIQGLPVYGMAQPSREVRKHVFTVAYSGSQRGLSTKHEVGSTTPGILRAKRRHGDRLNLTVGRRSDCNKYIAD